MYSVYIHTCPNRKRYVGMTRQKPEDRWKCGQGYVHCTDFHNAILFFGWRNITHEVVASGLERKEAESLERELIASYNTTDPEFGYNSHSGGLSGAKANDITRIRMSKAQSGSGNPMYGRSQSKHTKELIASTKRGEKSASARPVCQYDRNMIFIKKYPYIKAAKTETGASSIGKCCAGRLMTSGGYCWRYADEGDS